ncbi:MAG: formate dehydrogenase accessory sulfurtransferase FdhD [Desulfobaccales bacterium]
MSAPTREIRLWRLSQGLQEDTTDVVIVEEPLEIRLGGEPFQVLMRLPGQEKELALGFLYTEGIIRSLSEVLSLHFCGTATDPVLPPNVLDVSLAPEAKERAGRRHLEVAYSSCGLCAKEAVSDIKARVPPLTSPLSLTLTQLSALVARLPEAQPLFHATGGTHGVALASPDGAIFVSAEDVGRHNAMDKAIGQALLRRLDLTRLVALLSGRISFEMALKCVRAGIPILAAVSAPTSMALELAQEMGLTLVGFARPQRLNVYTHPERLRDLARG